MVLLAVDRDGVTIEGLADEAVRRDDLALAGCGASGSRSGESERSTCFLPGVTERLIGRAAVVMAQPGVSRVKT